MSHSCLLLVFINESHVGGNSELQSMYRAGDLHIMLARIIDERESL